jgi:hypothetical protein
MGRAAFLTTWLPDAPVEAVDVLLHDPAVRTTRAWMNLAGRLGRPAFGWNHDRVMRDGGRGLARRLGVALVAP